MTGESDTSDTGDLPPRLTDWQLEALRQPGRRIVTMAPRATSKSAGIKSLLRFHAESEGEWISGDDVIAIVSDLPHLSEDEQ